MAAPRTCVHWVSWWSMLPYRLTCLTECGEIIPKKERHRLERRNTRHVTCNRNGCKQKQETK